jgi:acyl-CoA dehydrogenase-like protein
MSARDQLNQTSSLEDTNKSAGTALADEAVFYQLWKSEHMASLEPASMAFRGGLLSDRLPWVFVSGYQAALHHTFPTLPKEGWSAFAVSEDKSDPETNPPSTLIQVEGAFLLRGTKSWIAASSHCDHLLVTAKEHLADEIKRRCVLINPNEKGVTLAHRQTPKFLAALSQGSARFEDVKIDLAKSLDEAQARSFGGAEPPFIMLASTGYLLRHLKDHSPELRDALLDIATGLSALCQTGTWTAKRLAFIDRKLQASVEAFTEIVDCDTLADWDADKMLLSLYSQKLQKEAK